MLTTDNASLYDIYPVIALGLNHNRTILILWNIEHGPEKAEINGILLMPTLNEGNKGNNL